MLASMTQTSVPAPVYQGKRPLTMQPDDQSCLLAMLGLVMPDGGRIVDVTYGEGGLWRGLSYAPEQYGGDFLHLPDDWTGRWNVVVWDPPHNTESGRKSRYFKRFDTGNASVQHRADISHLFDEFLPEAKRVLAPKGILLAKIGDQVHRARYRWQGFDFKAAVDATPGLTACQPFIVPTGRSATLRGHNWDRVLHGRRGFVYWFVVRKGRC